MVSLVDSDEVAESEDEGTTTKKVCGAEEEVVPCSQPDSDVEICPNDISPQEDRVDVTNELNRSRRPVRAASLGVGQYLVVARAAAASRACVEAGPRGARTKRQRRPQAKLQHEGQWRMFGVTIVMRLSRNLPRNPLLSLLPGQSGE